MDGEDKVESLINSSSPESTCEIQRSKGQSLVELALTLPLLLIILFGVLDLGRLFYAYATLTNSSREGARLGATVGTSNWTNAEAAIKARVKQEALGVLNLADANIVVDCAAYADTPPYAYSPSNCASAAVGDRLRVTVNFNFQFAALYLLGVQDLALSNNSTMAIIKR